MWLEGYLLLQLSKGMRVKCHRLVSGKLLYEGGDSDVFINYLGY